MRRTSGATLGARPLLSPQVRVRGANEYKFVYSPDVQEVAPHVRVEHEDSTRSEEATAVSKFRRGVNKIKAAAKFCRHGEEPQSDIPFV